MYLAGIGPVAPQQDDRLTLATAETDMNQETLAGGFEQSFSRYKDRTAIVFLREGVVETRLTYENLRGDSLRFARWLLSRDIGKGDRVVLFFPKCPAFVTAYLALQWIGAAAVPLNPRFKPSEMEYLLRDAEPKLVLAGAEEEDVVKRTETGFPVRVVDARAPYGEASLPGEDPGGPLALPDLDPSDPALVIYTSGTTGNPKGAMLTQGNLANDARNVVRVWEITGEDVLCHALPLFHVHGLCFALHTALLQGCRVVMTDLFRPREAAEVLADKDRFGCTLFMAVPTMYRKLLENLGDPPPDFGHMRLWTSGSAPLPPKEFRRIEDLLGQEPVEREGMSETGMNFSNPVRGARKPGSIGLPLPGVSVRVVDPASGQDVPAGEEGELWLRSASIIPGYWRKPEETAKTFRDGWFRTGDLGRVDEEGYYYLTDRLKHIIISGGENISPKEIENVIDKLEGVAESSVTGIPDEQWGEKVAAAVVAKPGASLSREEISAWCRKHLHDWKCPKEIAFVDRLPRNTMGKVLKEDVKKAFE